MKKAHGAAADPASGRSHAMLLQQNLGAPSFDHIFAFLVDLRSVACASRDMVTDAHWRHAAECLLAKCNNGPFWKSGVPGAGSPFKTVSNRGPVALDPSRRNINTGHAQLCVVGDEAKQMFVVARYEQD